MEITLCAYMAKKRNKSLRRDFKAEETDKSLLQEECSRLKARVKKVENIIKETLESIDKLQTDLDEANTSKSALENQAKIAKDRMAIL